MQGKVEEDQNRVLEKHDAALKKILASQVEQAWSVCWCVPVCDVCVRVRADGLSVRAVLLSSGLHMFAGKILTTCPERTRPIQFCTGA